MSALLDIQDLSITFDTNDGAVFAVNNVSLSIKAGQKLGLVGESGSGKSQIAFAILGLLARNARTQGRILYQGQDLLSMPETQLNKIRSHDIAMVFQDPMTALNPYIKIGKQLSEVLTHHKGMTQSQARQRALEVMDAVKIPDAKNRLNAYPHEFSGGMRQRIVIAMALLCQPKLLLADEPTTALDVTVQAQIMELLDDIQREFNMATLLITHDMGIIASFCDECMVLYGGQIMEQAQVRDLFAQPQHPYTKGLLNAIPSLYDDQQHLEAIAGAPPNISQAPRACPFAPRCTLAQTRCHEQIPALQGDAHRCACFAVHSNKAA